VCRRRIDPLKILKRDCFGTLWYHTPTDEAIEARRGVSFANTFLII
jgi:hypothetical protein